MQRKRVAVAVSVLVLVLILAVCGVCGQGKIRLYTEEGTIPSPNYIRELPAEELNALLKCNYFPEASCSNCGLRFYQSDNFGVVSKENFMALRSWFYNAMKNDMGGLQDHQALRMFDAVLALSAWRYLACGMAFRENKTSLPYIYAVLVVEESGQLAIYRMTGGGALTKMTSPDRGVRLVVFP